MFFEVPDWSVGKPVSEEEVIAARKADKAAFKASKPEKKVTFAPGEAQEKKEQREKPAKKQRVEQPEPEAIVEKSTEAVDKKSKVVSSDTEKLKAKLSGSRFRYLNQKLYESTSKDALSYFQEHQDDFLRYHEGFVEQTKRWPTNPVDVFIKDLRELVRKKKGLTVVDLGCGEGKLGKVVSGASVTVHSFDLVSVADHIKVASMTDVPLKAESVDLAIFSLSLMNTNFSEALLEANRILRPSGQLWIAEVESRFDGGFAGLDKFVKQLKELGFQLQGKVDTSHLVFVLMRFTRVKRVTSSRAASDLALKSCKYKKR